MPFPHNSSLPVHHRNHPLHPNFGEPGHGCLPKQITYLGGRSPKGIEQQASYIRVCSEVLHLETFDRHLSLQMYYRCLLLGLINIRIAKLGVCIVHWLLEVCTKVGGDWAWPSGYGGSSVSSYFQPPCTS